MNTLKKAISNIFKGAADALKTFPAAIGCAACFAIVTIIRIELEWPKQEPYNFLFNCLHWAFALGAIVSLPLITAAQSRINTKKAFLYANIMGVTAALASFLILFYFAGNGPSITGYRYAVISNIALARVSAIMLVSMLAFMVFAGLTKPQPDLANPQLDSVKPKLDFAKSFFMTHKAFIIAMIYGAVVMAGASGVAGAIQGLLYEDMSSKVYMYIGTLSGFLAFTIFVGYFPDFRKDAEDEHRQVAQNQPRFIEILLGSIMVPIVLALTVVLLLWAAKTISSGMTAYFYTLYGIAASYTIGGIWLHIMLTHHQTGMAKFYKRVYPIAALVILLFEAWAFVIQISASSLKFTEYAFGMVWILAAASAIFMLVRKENAHRLIVIAACILTFIYVLPIVGYNALPVTAQSKRLEKLLVSEAMLANGEIIPAAKAPSPSVRESITDAVDYLSYANDAKLPAWFDKNLSHPDKFKTAMGFEQTWPKTDYDGSGGQTDYMSTMLYLQPGAVDISGYQWALNPQDEYGMGQTYATVVGNKGTYDVYWDVSAEKNIPLLKIIKDETVILEKDMKELVDAVVEKYPLGQSKSVPGTAEDLTVKASCDEVAVMIVIRHIEISLYPKEDIINYWVNLDAIYMYEN